MPQLNSTIGPIAEVFSAVGTGIQGFNQSRAYSAEGAYQKQIYDSNAQIADIQAADAIDRGNRDASALKKQTKRLIGSQRAALAAQGIEVNDADALALQMDTAGQGAQDALKIKNNAWMEAWGYKVQSANYTSQGNFANLAAQNKSRNTILTTGLNIANDFASFNASTPTKTVPKYNGGY